MPQENVERALTLSGALLVVGFVVNGIQRMLWHPTGEEDDHEAIFREYAASDAWEATHLAEFVLVLVALAGLLVLCRALRAQTPYLALLATGALIASGATWAALQAVDGVTLKQAVDAWVAASGTEEATRLPMPRPLAGSSGASRATSGSCSAWPSCFWALRLS